MAPTFTTREEAPAVSDTPDNDDVSRPRHDPDDDVLLGGGGPTEAGWHAAEAGIWCMKEGQYRYIRGIKTPQLQTPDHFVVGKMLHAGRAAWFSRKFKTDAETHAFVKDEALAGAEEKKMQVSEAAKANAFRYLEEYIDWWSTRPKPQPVAAEYLVGPAPLEPGDPFPLFRTARLDDVSYYPESMGRLAIGECKTTSASIDECISQYTLHGQPLLQYVLWGTSQQGAATHGPVKGVVLDIIKKGYGKERSKFARHFVEITPIAVAWYVKNMRAFLRRFASVDWNTDAERNIQACTRLVGKARSACDYRDICMRGKAAAGNYVFKDGSSVAQWKPSDGKDSPPWE
jgi:hypothetical protein